MPSSRFRAKGNGFPTGATSGPNRWRTRSITDRAIGSIMTVVAVFEIHMLRKALATMKPSTRRSGRLPTRRMMWSAIRRCRPQVCIERAIMKPPRKRKMFGFA